MNFLKPISALALILLSISAGELYLTDENKRTLYKYRAGVIEFAEMMQEKHNIDKDFVINTLNQIKPTYSAIKNSNAPAEVVLTWLEYRDKMINQERIDAGKEIYHRYSHEFQFLEKKYGVPAEVLIAIAGIETSYGANQGNYRLIDTLTTLAFDYPRRKDFFQRELENLFLLSERTGQDITTFKGSYAGAFGISQFMPSSYFAYAKSFSDEHPPNIWDSKLDAFASIANYIKSHNWVSGVDYLYPAKYKGKLLDDYKEITSLEPKITYKELKKAGWSLKDPKIKIDNDTLLLPIVLTLDDSSYELYLVNENFYAISRYNPRLYYTMSVAMLSKKIKYD